MTKIASGLTSQASASRNRTVAPSAHSVHGSTNNPLMQSHSNLQSTGVLSSVRIKNLEEDGQT